MTNEAVDAVRLVADVLRQHGYRSDHSGGPGWHCGGDECSQVSGVWDEEYDEHVAEAVVAALGGLTRQWAVRYIDGGLATMPFQGEPPVVAVERTRELFSHDPKREIVTGWVGGWQEAEQ